MDLDQESTLMLVKTLCVKLLISKTPITTLNNILAQIEFLIPIRIIGQNWKYKGISPMEKASDKDELSTAHSMYCSSLYNPINETSGN